MGGLRSVKGRRELLVESSFLFQSLLSALKTFHHGFIDVKSSCSTLLIALSAGGARHA